MFDPLTKVVQTSTLFGKKVGSSIRLSIDYANNAYIGSTTSTSGSGPAAPSKRREQVRHAQRYVQSSVYNTSIRLLQTHRLQPSRRPARNTISTYTWSSTHRQRTQNYIKTLESEVVRLRDSELKLMQEKEKLERQVDILKTNHFLSELPLPAGIEDESPLARPPQLSDSDMPATISYSNDEFNHQRLHVNFSHQDPSQGLGYPLQSYPLAAPYHGQSQSQNPQSAPDLSKGW